MTNFGESAVKLSPSLQLQSFFTPHNAASLTASDLDLCSASVPVMPDVNGQFPHELIFCGKSPMIYVVNRDSMGVVLGLQVESPAPSKIFVAYAPWLMVMPVSV